MAQLGMPFEELPMVENVPLQIANLGVHSPLILLEIRPNIFGPWTCFLASYPVSQGWVLDLLHLWLVPAIAVGSHFCELQCWAH